MASTAVARRPKRRFGSTRQLPSGKWQARYSGTDGIARTARTDDGRPLTFDTKARAEKYLERVSADVQRGQWQSPEERRRALPQALQSYSEVWLACRTAPSGRGLADRTRNDYAAILRDHIWPVLGDVPLSEITPVMIREWHARLATGPTMRAHAYSLLKTIMATAVADEVIAANPCRIAGAGQAKRVRQIRPATLAELETIATAVPARYKLMVLLAAWCALRFGELTELRRGDIDAVNGIIRVRRGVVRVPGGRKVKGPKSQAGERDVNIPPHLMPAVRDHLAGHVAAGQDALLFPARNGGHMQPSALQRVFYRARAKAGRDDLAFHDLRHTGATLAAAAGATLAELMARLGHSTVSAAMRYQHAAADRDKVIAAALSELATVTPITAAPSSKAARSG